MPGAKTLASILDETVGSSDRGIIFIEGTDKRTFKSYRNIKEEALRLLGEFQERGIKQKDYIILFTDNNDLFITAFWAAVIGGIVPVPITYGRSTEIINKLSAITLQIGSVWLFTHDKALTYLERIGVSVFYKDIHESTGGHLGKGIAAKVMEDDTALVQFSSGSTGNPKGVVLTHKNLITNISDIITRSLITENDSMLCWMPLTHDMGLIGMHLVGVKGRVVQAIMPTDLFIRRPLLWMSLASELKSTLTYSPNFGYQYFLAAFEGSSEQKWQLQSLRVIYNGAEPILFKVCEHFLNALIKYGLSKKSIAPAYGMAEASVAVTLAIDEELTLHSIHRTTMQVGREIDFVSLTHPSAVSFVEVGMALPNCAIRITDDADINVGPNFLGHIHIRGDNVTGGYTHQTNTDGELFTSDDWLRTGDMGFLVGNKLVVTGRSKNLIIINGQNFYPHDIEGIIIEEGYATAGNVAACGISVDGHESLVIFLRMQNASRLTSNLKENILELLHSKTGILLHDIVAIKKIPKTTSGKVKHRQLSQEYLDIKIKGDLFEDNNFPPSDKPVITADIVRLLQSQLSKSTVLTLQDSIFSYGLNSLQLSQFTARLGSHFSVRLTLQEVFNNPSINKLAGLIALKEKINDNVIRSIEEQYIYRMTDSQRDLWMLSQLDPTSISYNITCTLNLGHVKEVDLVFQSLVHLLTRHEGLRTNIMVIDDNPFVKINPLENEKISFEFIRLSDATEVRSLEDVLKKEASWNFDMSIDYLIRSALVQESGDSFILVLTLHHFIVDGWSMNLIANDLSRIYFELNNGVSNYSTIPLALHYKDYAAWTNNYIIPEPINESIIFPQPEINCLRRRPAVKSYKGCIEIYLFPDHVSSSLRSLSSRLHVTPAAVVLSTVALLVYRYSSQEKFVIGMPAANRNDEDIMGIVGYFLKTLPLNIQIDTQTTFLDFIRQLSKTIFETSSGRSVDLKRDFNSHADIAHGSMFNVLLLYQNLRNLRSDENAIEFSEYFNGTCISDLCFEFIEDRNNIKLHLRYSSDLFDKDDIKRLLSYYINILHSSLQESEKSLFSYLSPSSQEYDLLRTLNAYTRTPDVFKSCVSIFEDVARKFSNKIAVIYGQIEVSYKQLDEDSNRLANLLLKNHIFSKQLIAVCMDQSIDLVITILAILKTGSAYLPISISTPLKRVELICDECNVSLLLTDSTVAWLSEKPQYVRKWININDLNTSQFSPQSLEVSIKNEDLAYVIYTSGTTGAAKGVMIEHQNLSSIARQWKDDFSLCNDTVVLQMANPAFDVFTGDLAKALFNGGTLVLFSYPSVQSFEHLINALLFYKITVFESTPAFLIPALDYASEQGIKFDSLRLLIVGSDTCLAEDFSRINIWYGNQFRIINSYGTTETTIDASFFEFGDFDLQQTSNTPIGKALRNVYFRILDSDGIEVPIGVIGELFIGGDGVGRGYINDPFTTADRFIDDRIATGKRLYKTGDLARTFPDGTVDFLGRQDSQVKIRGYRVDLSEVENAILKIKEIKNAMVFLDSTNVNQKELVAFIQTDNLEVLDHHTVHQFLKLHLPDYMVPGEFRAMETFPLTSNGKIDRKCLVGTSQFNELPRKILKFSSTEEESFLLKTWSKVLGIDNISIEENFFAIGGNSLKALSILADVNKRYSRLELRNFFQYPTIFEFSKLLINDNSTAESKIYEVEEQDSYPVSESVRSMWILCQQVNVSLSYNTVSAFVIEKPLNLEIFKKAFLKVVNQFEILRTSFHLIEGELRQRVHEKGKESNEVQFLGDEHDIEALVKQLSSYKFDFEKGFLYKTIITSNKEGEYIVIVSIHHIITDYSSRAVLVQEWIRAYHDISMDCPGKVNDDKIQYKDYVVWKKSRSLIPAYEEHRRYWKQQMLSVKGAMEIPCDGQRNAKNDLKASSLSFSFDPIQIELIKSFSKEHSLSQVMIHLALINILLKKYTNEDSIVIGLPSQGRGHHLLDSQLGYFVNVLPIKIDLNRNESFLNILKKVKDRVLKGFEHQDFPFASMVEERKNSDRNFRRNPFFEITVDYYENESFDKELHLIKRPHQLSIPTFYNPFEVSFFFTAQGFEIKYDLTLFSEGRIKRMGEHFLQLCSNALGDQLISVRDLKHISKQEESRLLGFSNKLSHLNSLPDATHFITLFEQSANESPLNVAVRFGDLNLTYRELNEKANRFASFLQQEFNVGYGDGVALILPRSTEFIIAMLAVSKIRGYFIPIDVDHPQEYKRAILARSSPKLIVTEDVFDNSFNNYSIATFNQFQESEYLPFSTDFHDTSTCLAYVIFTSGSTGTPKGVMIENSNLINYLNWSNRYYFGDHTRYDFGWFTSVSFDLSYTAILSTLIRGASLVIFEGKDNFSHLIKAFGSSEIQAIKITPSHIDLLSHLNLSQTNLKVIIVGGETLRKDHIEALVKINPLLKIYNEYGPTEATIGCSVKLVTENLKHDVSIGIPIDNSFIYVLNDDLQFCGIDQLGEIYIGGYGLARGYINAPELTHEKFIYHLNYEPQTRLYKTGDVGCWRANGQLQYFGRNDRQVKIKGHRIELEAVESRLLQCQEIINVAAVFEKSENPEIIVYYVSSQGDVIDKNLLTPYLDTVLPRFAMPSKFLRCDFFPLTNNGKIDQKALKEIAESVKVSPIIKANSSHLEKILLMWIKVLDKNDIGLNQNFFDLGGDSFKLVQLFVLMEEGYPGRITIPELFSHATVREQAGFISGYSAEPNNNETLTEINL